MNDVDAFNVKFDVEGDAWVPTPHGMTLARYLNDSSDVEDLEVLELGAGTGIHTVLLARQNPKHIVATEIKEEFVDLTRKNMELNDCAENVSYVVADWLNLEGEFDAVVTNPPFARSGKQNRRYFIDDLILNAHKCLRPGGLLIFIQSSMADLAETERQLERNGYNHEVVMTHQGPFRDYYYEDETFMREIQDVPEGFEVRDGKEWETLYVVRAKLESWNPPATAHAVP